MTNTSTDCDYADEDVASVLLCAYCAQSDRTGSPVTPPYRGGVPAAHFPCYWDSFFRPLPSGC